MISGVKILPGAHGIRVPGVETMFAFSFDKALQAAAYLLRREPCRDMNYMRLVKLMYLADRESIRQTGQPITGDDFAAMKQGPVLSNVLDLIRGTHLRHPDWARFIHKDEYKVRLVGEPGLGNLSRFEIELLERVAEEHRSRDEWAMVEFTHELAEWRKNDPGNSMKWIPLADILEAIGRLDDLADIEADARTQREFARLFGA